jgi:hypothetical protein
MHTRRWIRWEGISPTGLSLKWECYLLSYIVVDHLGIEPNHLSVKSRLQSHLAHDPCWSYFKAYAAFAGHGRNDQPISVLETDVIPFH